MFNSAFAKCTASHARRRDLYRRLVNRKSRKIKFSKYFENSKTSISFVPCILMRLKNDSFKLGEP
jgi:hypothetical protein